MIDREKVIKALSDFSKFRICLSNLIPWAEIDDALALLKEQPDIVRCKDCEHCFVEGFVHERNVCELHPEIENPSDDWFCADGERRCT